jgi:hypothetical protein
MKSKRHTDRDFEGHRGLRRCWLWCSDHTVATYRRELTRCRQARIVSAIIVNVGF